MTYLWQQSQWDQLLHAKQSNRLPHALMLTGDEGVGKYDFAINFTQSLLCHNVKEGGVACGFCHDCALVKNSSHPNLLIVEPEKPGSAIKVDQVRSINDFVHLSSTKDDYRVVVIHPAHSMNLNASNALLKTLEEPPEGALIILVLEQYGRLPVTIMSRCQRIVFPKPNREMALDWLASQTLTNEQPLEQLLQLANGSPLLAVKLIDEDLLQKRKEILLGLQQLCDHFADPIELASQWHTFDLVKWIEIVTGWIIDIVRLQIGAHVSQLKNQDYESALRAASRKTLLQKNIHTIDCLQTLQKQLNTGVNFNKQLAIERVLIRWMEPMQ